MCCLFLSSFDLFLDLHCHFSSLNCCNNLRASPMIYPEYTTLFISSLPSWRLDLSLAKAKEELHHRAKTLYLFLVCGLTTPSHFLSSALKSSQIQFLSRTYFTFDFYHLLPILNMPESSLGQVVYHILSMCCVPGTVGGRDTLCSAHPFSDSVYFT